MKYPLDGITVIDLSHALAGPFCTTMLADYGAQVIKVEPPTGDIARGWGSQIAGGETAYFVSLHRNKRGVVLDLKTAEGKEVFFKLLEKADVVIENYRVGALKRMGLDYEAARKRNPGIIYCSISGFGQDGPYRDRAALDLILQAESGMISVTGEAGGRGVRCGVSIADLTAGNLLALGVMMALFDREVTGVGRWVHTSLLESIIFMLDFQATRYLVAGEVAGQAGNDHPTSVPTGVFPASDGLFNIAASSARVFHRCCDALGKPEWKTKAEWDTQQKRSKVRADINAAISEITKHKPTAHWVEVMEAAGVPCGPINTIDKVFADPQVQHVGIAQELISEKLGKLNLLGSAINMVGTSKKLRRATQDLGHDSEEVLASVGYTKEQLADLRAKGVI